MRLAPIFGLSLGLLTVLPISTQAATLRVSEPSIIIAPVGQVAAVLLELENSGAEDDRLIGADAGDISQGITLHTHLAQADGTKHMVEATDGIALPAGSVQVLGRAGDHALGRDGDHAMFINLARIPMPGEQITVTLRFENEPDMTIQVPVSGHPTTTAQP